MLQQGGRAAKLKEEAPGARDDKMEAHLQAAWWEVSEVSTRLEMNKAATDFKA